MSAGLPAFQPAQYHASPLPAEDAGAEHRFNRIKPLRLRPERPRRLRQLPRMLQPLANDDRARARMRIAPASRRVARRSQKVGDRSHGFLEVRFVRGELNQVRQAGQRVADDVGLGVADLEATLVLINKRRVRVQRLAALIEQVPSGELGA